MIASFERRAVQFAIPRSQTQPLAVALRIMPLYHIMYTEIFRARCLSAIPPSRPVVTSPLTETGRRRGAMREAVFGF